MNSRNMPAIAAPVRGQRVSVGPEVLEWLFTLAAIAFLIWQSAAFREQPLQYLRPDGHALPAHGGRYGRHVATIHAQPAARLFNDS